MSKGKPSYTNIEYNEPKKFEGRCTLCGKTNTHYNYSNDIKSGAFGTMYCDYCRTSTTHTTIKEVKQS